MRNTVIALLILLVIFCIGGCNKSSTSQTYTVLIKDSNVTIVPALPENINSVSITWTDSTGTHSKTIKE